MIEVVSRDWLARITSYSSDNLKINTPEIFHISTDRYRAPDNARLIIIDDSVADFDPEKTLRLMPSHFFDSVNSTEQRIDPGFRGAEMGQSPVHGNFPAVYLESSVEFSPGEIIPVGDAISLSKDSRKFAERIIRLRTEFGPNKLVYMAGIADPLNLSLLIYMGADLVDSFGTIIRSSLGQVILSGRVVQSDSDELERIPSLGKKPTSRKLIEHNLGQLEHELLIVREAITKGKLRELVELRARHSAWMTRILRFIDREEFDSLEKWMPIVGGPFPANSKESLWRPDIERYRRRVLERYIPPSTPEILLLLPCSARKPYLSSKTHRMFREVIRRASLSTAIHEVIVTSPLGIVPRELEFVYPAQQYDIPVTGHWDEDEKKIVTSMLSDILKRRSYAHIIAHLDIEMEFLYDLLQKTNYIHTGGDNVTNGKNLEMLENSLRSISSQVQKPDRAQRTLEDVIGMASYQFGDAWPAVMNRSSVRGRYPMLKVIRDGVQLCSLVSDRGTLALTLAGGEAIASTGKYGVEIDDFPIKGNIFAVGVKDANDDIRIGDEVYVHHGGDIRAVGVARMTPLEMMNLERGEAVHVRHYR